MQTDVHKTAYLVYTTKKVPHVTVTVAKMRFVGRNSQVITILYIIVHNRLYTDFKIRVISFKETLPRSLKKEACHGRTLFYIASELLKICGHRIVTYKD